MKGEAPPDKLPASQLAGEERRRYFNLRREQDPLGEGHAQTWRMRLIKVAAQIMVSTRRVLVQLPTCWPHLEHYRQISEAVLGAIEGQIPNTA